MTIDQTKLARRSFVLGASSLALAALSGCGAIPAGGPMPGPAPSPMPKPVTGRIRGFNQNWAQMPALSTGQMVPLMQRLRPGMIRYPGGTATHGWDWQNGVTTKRAGGSPHLVRDVKSLSDSLGAPVIVVLDVIYRSLDDQLAMLRELRRIGVPFSHVEMGNEIYAQDADYSARFPSGADYGAEANRWAAAVKAEFPDVLVSAILLAREAGPANPRGQTWNRDVLSANLGSIDAWTFHLYIPAGGSAAALMANYRDVTGALALGGKPVWITEYGNQSEGASDYLSELLALADAVEAEPGVTIALNHQMIGGGKNKITPDGMALTAEGDAFVRRVGG